MQQLFGKAPYKTVVLSSATALLKWWPFLRQGWKELCEPRQGNVALTVDEFLTMLLRIVSMGDEDGAVVLFTTLQDKPLGFVAVMNDSETPAKRTALIYLGYSTGRYSQAPAVAVNFVEKWAKARRYTELHVQSRRLSGASMRLFRHRMGFQPVAALFSKPL